MSITYIISASTRCHKKVSPTTYYFSLGYPVISKVNFNSKYTFEIIRTSRFQSWPYFLNLEKIWWGYCQKQIFIVNAKSMNPTWQESLPPSALPPAQISEGLPLAPGHSEAGNTGRLTSWGTRGSGNWPPSAVTPQPATVAVLPSNVVASVVLAIQAGVYISRSTLSDSSITVRSHGPEADSPTVVT